MAARKKVKSTQCPGGHTLPRTGCTPLVCVDKVTSLSRVAKTKPSREDKTAIEGYRQDASYAQSRKKVRDELLPVPQLNGADAEEWVEQKKVALLPQALTEIEFQLKYGGDKERVEAARDVMRMNGLLNRDAPTGVGATIVINMAEGAKMPWHKKVEVVDAQVTPPTPR